MTVDAVLFNRLLGIADAKAARGYTVKSGQRRGLAASAARNDLEALQYAIAHLKDEGRVCGFSEPVNLRQRA